MSVVGKKCTTGILAAAVWLAAGSIGINTAFGRTADGAAEGVNLQASGIVDANVPLVSVAASGVDAFDESDEVLGLDVTIPGLGSITADVVSAATRHFPFDHLVNADATTAGLATELGIVTPVGGVSIPILDLDSGTIASEAEVTGTCDAFSAVGGATIEDLTISILGIDQPIAVPVNPPPNFEVLDEELTVPIGIASVTAQVLVIANEQDIAADESGISVNALRVTIGLEITVLAVTLEQDINLVIAHSHAAFENCNEVDLSVEKTTSLDGNATTGEPFQYTVTVGNNSLVDATAIEITDLLPPELEFIAFINQDGGDCSHDSGLITCQWLTIPASSSVAVTYEVMPVAAGTVTNSVGVSTGDTNIGDTGDQVEIIIDQAVDLEMEKSIDNEPLVVGQAFNYVFDYTNFGVNDATQVDFADLIPDGIAITSAPAGGDCTVDGAPAEFPLEGDGMTVLVCVIQVTVPADGGMAQVLLPALPLAQSEGTVPVNYASWSDEGGGNPDDPDPGTCETDPNCDTSEPEEPVQPPPSVVLVMEKSIDNQPLVVGQAFNYVFDYTNTGVEDAAQVDFADLVPDGIAITSAPLDGTCTVDGAPAVFPLEGDGMTVLVCVIQVAVPADGGMAQVLLPAMPLAQSEGTTPVNYASWSDQGGGNPDDPDPGTCETDPNCDSSQPDDPVQPALFVDLEVEMSIDGEPLIVGQPFDYVFTYTNNGNIGATQVDFAALLPFGIEITGPPDGGICTVDGTPAEFPVVGDDETLLECLVITTVPADGGMAVVTLPAVATEAGEQPVIHVGWSDEGNGNPEIPNPGCADNINCATVAPAAPIGTGVELVMEKSIDNEPLVVGQVFNYVFDYTNNGVNDATQVDFADLVPDGIAITSAPVDGTCTVDGDPAAFPVEGDGVTVLVCVIGVTVPADGGMAQVLLSAMPLAQSEGTTPVNYASWSDEGGGNPDDPDPGTCETDPNCDTSEPGDPVQPGSVNDIFSDRFEQ